MSRQPKKGQQVAPPSSSQISRLEPRESQQVAPSQRPLLDIKVRVEKSIDGVEMGVLENGMPYLTQSGLARMTGVARKTIFDLAKEWEEKYSDPLIGKGRNDFLKEYLFRQGYNEPTLYIETVGENGTVHHAFSDIVCMGILEYYAFEAQNTNDKASRNFRNLARYGLQKFIYDALQYAPVDKWLYYRDRVSILADSVPQGYFSVFREISGLVVDLINIGMTVDDRTIPDISVGQAWSKYWTDNDLDSEYGPRDRYEHNYPTYYSQAESNPQPSWAYPEIALPRFRVWFREEYLPTKFPKYILRKAKLLPGGKQEAQHIAELVEGKATRRAEIPISN